jgi:CubicO group peptidase (beta-lactamase class C family)
MQPTSRFGEAYQYSNLMAAGGGFIGGSLVNPGRSWAPPTTRRCGRGCSAARHDAHHLRFPTALGGNVALPHDIDIDGKRTVPAAMDINYSVLPVRPTGGMWTSARDLAKYLRMELASGRCPKGRSWCRRTICSSGVAPRSRSARMSSTAWVCWSTRSTASRWSATAAACSATRAT